ncbi:MAG: recombinase family protein [Magnetococcales bacterium]|nr:recombinase family protein [Magnetococcales bacterium]
MDFNSLDAQREACESYIASQKAEGWLLVADRYDDGGFSGGNLERPALKRLLKDIEAGKINLVVMYKIDRLTRSLMDFAKLVEVFEKHNVTFASVTQSFNTTTSMGRLTLNMLLSFAQYEREISAERIRDKVAASKKKGMWMGGHPPFGYDVRDRKLVINESEAETVRWLFQRFMECRSATQMVRELTEKGVHGKRGNPLDKPSVYRLLKNHLFIGKVAFQGKVYEGEHDGIVDPALWEQVNAIMASNNFYQPERSRAQTTSLLMGIIRCQHCNMAMSPTFSCKAGKRYHYYICKGAENRGRETCPLRTVPAGEIEAVAINQVRTMLQSPELVVKTWRASDGISERDVTEALRRLDPVWEELFPVEQQRLVQLLISRLDVAQGGVKVHLRSAGLDTLAHELSDLWKSKEVVA